MILPNFQYVTHPNEQFDDLTWVHRLKDNGCNWVQLRLKEEEFHKHFPTKHFLLAQNEIADKLRAITLALDMKLTINDSLAVAKFSNADACHLGQTDVSPEITHELINFDGIVGGSINSFAELAIYKDLKVNYFGVGPLRATTTKLNTKEVLGMDGYRLLLNQMKDSQINIPVYAIGNVKASDVHELQNIGVYGVAVSGEIFNQMHSNESIQSFTRLLS